MKTNQICGIFLRSSICTCGSTRLWIQSFFGYEHPFSLTAYAITLQHYYITWTALMDNGSHDRVAVVTGSSRGIGKAIAREFARKSYCVVLNSRDEVDLNRAAQDMAKEIGNDQRIHYTAAMCRKKIFVDY
jgi:predicted amino acid dehydrogenase